MWSQLSNNKDNSPIQQIVIVGADVLGWCAAVALARGLQGQNVNITLVGENEETQPSDRVIHTSSHLFDFHRSFGIDDRQLLTHGHAKLTFSSQYINFLSRQDAFFIGEDRELPRCGNAELHQVLAWLGITEHHSYSLSAQAAEKLLLALPSNQRGRISNSFIPAVNLDAATYQWFMKGAATQLGVKFQQGTIETINHHAESGFIQSLQLTDGKVILADLVIDNNSDNKDFKALLAKRSYIDCSQYLPFDSKMNCDSDDVNQAKPYQQFHANKDGWCEINFMPKYRTANFHYLASDISDAAVREQLSAYLPNAKNFKIQQVNPGYLTEPLQGNCFVIGDAAGYLGTSPFSQLIMMQRSISKLLELFPGKACLPANTAQINRAISKDYQQALDYSVLMFSYCQQEGDNQKELFSWQCDSEQLPSELQNRIALFLSSGRVKNELNPLISRDAWINLLKHKVRGQQGYDPMVNSLDKEQANNYLLDIKKQINQSIATYRAYK